MRKLFVRWLVWLLDRVARVIALSGSRTF